MNRILLSIAMMLLATAAYAQGTLIVAYQNASAFGVINTTTGAQTAALPISIAGQTITGYRGLAGDPTTGLLYAVPRLLSGDDRLYTINSVTGVGTFVGQMTEGISGIQFTTAGQLYAVTGDGALAPSVPRSLFTVNKATGACTLAVTLSVTANQGEAIAFNPTNVGVMYHFGGSAPLVFETVNLTTFAQTPIVVTGAPAGLNILSFAWDSNSNAFYTANNLNTLGRMTPAGAYTAIGAMPGNVKGMIVVPTIAHSVVAPPLALGTTPQGTSSAAVSFNVTGFNCVGPITVTAPTNVVVSLQAATAFGPSVATLAPAASGQIASTQIFVRIPANAAAGPIAANLTLTSNFATTVLLSVTGTVTVPEMDVFTGATPVADGGTHNAGNFVITVTQNISYQIQNNGAAPLNLTAVPAVAFGALTNVQNVTLATPPATPVAASGNTSFTVSFQVIAAAAFSFTISIDNNDTNENPYNWTVSGTGTPPPAPEMDVTRAANPVADGGTDTVVGATAGIAVNLTYVIANSGNATLTLSGLPVVPAGEVNCNTNITTQPGATVTALANTSLIMTVTPIAAGAFSFTLSIANNDANENPYNWTVSGNASAAPAPEMDVSRTGPIADGGADNAGNLPAGAAAPLTYTITNNGTAALTITLPVNIGGQMNCTATVTTPPGTSVNTAANTTLVVSVTPSGAGAFAFTVSITNNDSNENPYNWTVNGIGTVAPEVGLARGAAIADAGNDAAGSLVAGLPTDLTYVIDNSGTGPLTITLPVTIGSLTNCGVVVSTPPAINVAAAGATSMVLQVTPALAGPFSFTVSMTNDDANENPYDWTVTGTAVAPEMDVTRGAAPIADNGSDAAGSRVFGAAFTLTYTVTNSGTSDLTLVVPIVAGTATNCSVNVTTQPAATVAAAATTSVVISVTPTAAGAFSFNVDIDSDDEDEDIYSWSVAGTAVAPPPPEEDKDDSNCSTQPNTSSAWMALAALALLALGGRVRRARL